MSVALCNLTLRLPENSSLKGKRMVVKSIQQRLHNRFNVSVAEVEHNDKWQLAGIAIVAVSNNDAHANEVVAKAVEYIEGAAAGRGDYRRGYGDRGVGCLIPPSPASTEKELSRRNRCPLDDSSFNKLSACDEVGFSLCSASSGYSSPCWCSASCSA